MIRFALASIASFTLFAAACDTPLEGDSALDPDTTDDTLTNPSDLGLDTSPPARLATLRDPSGNELPDGGETTPLVLDGIPPYSHGTVDLTFVNETSAPLTLRSVTLEPLAPTEDLEFALTLAGRTERLPVQTRDLLVPPGQGLAFGLHFMPLASGPRDVKVRFAHSAGADLVVTVHARGRDNATLSPVVTTDLERLLARDNTGHSNGLYLGGLAAGVDGSLYFSGNASEWGDAFNKNLVVGKVAANGALAWVYEWNEPYEQAQADVGNNGQTGGPADAIDVDALGNVFTTAYRVACDRTGGAPETAFVLGIEPDGHLRWARSLSNGGTSDDLDGPRQYLRGYVIDASLVDRVLVAGRVTETGGFLLTALSKADGATLWARDITFGAGESRVGALAVDLTTGAAYVGGIQGAVPFMARIDGVDGKDGIMPSLAWAKSYRLGQTSVHGVHLDGQGLLTVFENRGLQSQFLAARIATSDGSIAWSKTWDPGNAGQNHNSMVVTRHGSTAVFGGRVGITPFDTQGGDGFLLGLEPKTGAYRWSAFHYGGKGAETMTHDHVVALASTPAGLWALHQQTPGANNGHHFWGRWYQGNDDTLAFPAGDGSGRLADAGLSALDVTGQTELALMTQLQNRDTLQSACAPGAWVDWTRRVTASDPVEAEANGFQCGTHGLIQRLSIDD